MLLHCSELADRLGGKLLGPDRPVDGVSIDSRAIQPGGLFVPIIADRDGHDFIAAAITAGAAAHLSSRDEAPSTPLHADPVTVIRVDDTAAALTEIGRMARDRLNGPVVGVTGSVGKTSMKDLTLAACDHPDRPGGRAWASAQSFNNELGVPLTLANAPGDTGVAIVEMGARGIGHIAELCAVARPKIGVVTCVALAHSELFGSLEAVAAAKGELIEAVPADGAAVLNADDPLVAAMAERTEAQVITYGAARDADVVVDEVRVDEVLRPTFTLRSPWGSAEVTIQARGAHMAHNAAGALAAASAAGISFADAVAGLATGSVSPWRMDVQRTPGGTVVINDAYNANPTSMRAAVGSLLALDADPRVAVVGVMAELGDEGPAEHEAVAKEAKAAGVRMIAVGAPAYGAGAEHVADLDSAHELVAELPSGAAVLVKGSRIAGLERLAERLITG